jgi:hypothetical protein
VARIAVCLRSSPWKKFLECHFPITSGVRPCTNINPFKTMISLASYILPTCADQPISVSG